MNALPAISNPSRYLGLFVFDFGDHVGVGYTAGEIDMLRATPEFQRGAAYQVYRIHENGGFELRGVLSTNLSLLEAICFLRADGTAARRDYDEILRAAHSEALPVEAELRLLRSYIFKPPDLTALIYPAHASHLLSGWIGQARLSPGDRVEAGVESMKALETGTGLTVKSTRLPSKAPQDRTLRELMDSVRRPLQR